MMRFSRLLGTCSAAALLMAPAAIYAQETASEVRGSVISPDGAPVAGAKVTLTHVPTSSTSTFTTTDAGQFFQSGLRVGGPYRVVVEGEGFRTETVENLFFQPGQGNPVRIVVSSREIDTVVVTGTTLRRVDLNNGVGSNFTSNDIENQPSLNRDVISTLARDPLAASNGPNNLSVAGVNPRFNGVTIDGARQQDAFGLGTNTFATARSPINIDIIESVSLVATDYGVTASGFTGGLVNVTTKGGTNEFDGSAFYYFRDESYIGEKAFGGQNRFTPGPFEEKEYGFTLRGPIVKDKLFFAFSYDRFETAQSIDFIANDTNNGLTPAFFEALNTLVQNTYGIDLGGRPQQAAVPEETERYFARIDWDINENHRLQLGYQQTDDVGVSNVSSTGFQSNWYDTPTELKSYTAQLFSRWTPELSTTLRASYIDYTRGQVCRAEPGVGEFQFILNNANTAGTPLAGTFNRPGSTITINGGCDRFRHANEYFDKRLTLFASADYFWNNILFTVGGEYENLEVFNVFVERSLGSFQFTGATAGQDIINRIANVQYRNVPSNNSDEGAAAWAYSRWSAFAQARWDVTPNFEVSAGARFEYITTGDDPTNDPTFQTAVGFPNTSTTDGLSLFMPRIGFKYRPFDRTQISGGFGLFAGGNPGVWTSNAYQVPAVFASGNRIAGVTGRDIPPALLAAVANGTPQAIDAIDPNFELPSDWKASVRLDQTFDLSFNGLDLGRNYLLSAQLLYTQSKDSFLWREFAQTNQANTRPLGVAPDGRPIYADLQALGITNRTVLTNSSGDQSIVGTISLAKDYENGFGFYASYAYQDIEFITEGSSSRGVSSFRGQVDQDRNFPSPRTSIYEVEHAFKLSLSYERDFIKDLNTRFDLFGQFASGAPYTYTFDVENNNALFGRNGGGENPFDNSPLYVPNLPDDPLVVYRSTFDRNAFANYVINNRIEQGKIHEVNSAKSAWNQRWDFRFQQDLPGLWGAKQFVGDNRLKLVVDIENVANLLNNKWGTRINAPGNGQVPVVAADLVRRSDVAALGVNAAPALTGDAARTACVTAQSCVYRFNSFRNAATSFRSTAGSVWFARVGIRYEF